MFIRPVQPAGELRRQPWHLAPASPSSPLQNIDKRRISAASPKAIVKVSAPDRSPPSSPRSQRGGGIREQFSFLVMPRQGTGVRREQSSPEEPVDRSSSPRPGWRDARLQQWAGPLGNFHLAGGQGRQRGYQVSTSTETVPTLPAAQTTLRDLPVSSTADSY